VNCQETQLWLHGYVDGELDLVRTIELEQHLHTCARCARAYRDQQALRTALGSGALYAPAPPQLQQRIQAAARQAARPTSAARIMRWRWFNMAAALACIAFLAWGLGRLWPTPAPDDRLSQEVLASHVRSLMANHLADVASSDRHTVKPWFDGKLDFSPVVEDQANQGFPLTGGRLDYLDNRPVAALVYRRQQHVINLFIWPAPQGVYEAPTALTRQGYNLVHWTGAGMTYWAVSDLNSEELQEFVHLIQTNATPTPTP